MNDKPKFFSDDKEDQNFENDKDIDISNSNLSLKDHSDTTHKVIHRKDGRLHIYVRQDKYKGELKSHNWVGRTYINGKQKSEPYPRYY